MVQQSKSKHINQEEQWDRIKLSFRTYVEALILIHLDEPRFTHV